MVKTDTAKCCKLSNKSTIGSKAPPSYSVKPTTSNLSFKDKLSWVKVRWGINRFRFSVAPGLYSLGKPDQSSSVLVTANYRMSFDKLRQSLKNMNAYILVLDTKGVNVWCAAGKGTFGTDELIKRIKLTKLTRVVDHGKIIIPQLGAPGIAAHKVKKETGFKVIYGPVRAKDIKQFINNNLKATEKMRTVTFNFKDRLVLTSLEFVQSLKYLLILIPILFGFSFLQHRALTPQILFDVLTGLGIILSGTVLVPLFLPWIPVRALALKGWIVGVAITLFINLCFMPNTIPFITNLFLFPPIVSFLALNFTGSTTYTSLSGVVKEMQYAVPLIIFSLVIGLTGKVIQIFI